MQEIHRIKPSTVSRRFSVAAGFYRTCVIDGVLARACLKAVYGWTADHQLVMWRVGAGT
jgi:hypothetical protein